MSPPAAADTNATVLINGAAEVGKWFSEQCGSDGEATVTGRGLYLPNWKTIPGVANGDREEHGVFHFRSIANGLVVTDQAGNPPHPAFIDLEICGYLSPIVDGMFPMKPPREDGLGAACYASRGHDGQGWVTDTTTGQIVQVQEFGWLHSVGGTMPVTGRYAQFNESTGQAEGKPVLIDPLMAYKGAVLGLIDTEGGMPCTGFKFLPAQFNNGNGAQIFNWWGVLQLIADVTGIPNTGSKCKDDGGPAGMDGVKKSHANKPGTGQCPEKEPVATPTPSPSSSNQPPAVPTLVSPSSGHQFAANETQTFTVQSTDPQGDLYQGEVVVENLSGTPVASFTTAPATSGANSSGSPSPVLPPGSYNWRARACDPLGSGSCSLWSGLRAVSVASATWESAMCDQSTVVDGFLSDVFLRLTSKMPQARTAWVCLRADLQSAFNRGGRLVVSHSDPAAVLQTGAAGVCEPFAGTPLLNGEVGDSADPPTHFTYRAVLKEAGDVKTVCVRVTRAGMPILDHSVAMDAPGGGDVIVEFRPDPTGAYPAVEDPPPNPARPSADCQLAATGKTRVLNAEVAGVRTWLYAQKSGATTKLCVRANDVGGGGGRLTITEGTPGGDPIVVQPAAAEPDAPGSQCTLNVWNNSDPVAVKVRRSAQDADPLAVCVGVAGTNVRVLVDLTPGGTPPNVVWTADAS